MVSGDKLRESLTQYVPADSVETLVDWIRMYRISVRIKKSRASKYGDYRSPHAGKGHQITINYDLNPYAFLLTFTHEVAHLTCYIKFGNRVYPHGEEWKREFRYLLKGFVDRKIFPEDVQLAITRYLVDPAASSCTDVHLQKTLRKYNPVQDGWMHVEDIPENGTFELKNGKRFIKHSKLRKNFVCFEIDTQHKYFIPPLLEAKLLIT
jgi:predicted SprT family Zn-dependent metalloprotease